MGQVLHWMHLFSQANVSNEYLEPLSKYTILIVYSHVISLTKKI